MKKTFCELEVGDIFTCNGGVYFKTEPCYTEQDWQANAFRISMPCGFVFFDENDTVSTL